jgi:hypothetical protein
VIGITVSLQRRRGRAGGYVGFTESRFWVMLVDETRKTPAAVSPSDGEAISLMRTHAAYTGKYDADPGETPRESR